MLSSLPLEILFYFNRWWDAAFTIIMAVLFIWKGNNLPYSENMQTILGFEVAMVFVLGLLEWARLFLGSQGNKTEQVGPLVWMFFLSLPAAVANVYYLHLQIYVTRVDLVVNIVSLVFIGLELLLALLTIITFAKSPSRASS
jgi:transmembrane protein 216|tara:strand:- start:97 stop:522 length:426 start_codon:yes stop_codon:yes gene_type:complete